MEKKLSTKYGEDQFNSYHMMTRERLHPFHIIEHQKIVACPSTNGYNSAALSPASTQRTAMRIETHQIEGLDERRRVFNRHVEIDRTDSGYTAKLYYEGRFYLSDSKKIIKEALGQLVESLKMSGFSRLRSRLNFRGKRYLAEREPWVDYQDDIQRG